HPRLQQPFTVVNADFDAEDQVTAFVTALHVAGGEFALSIDLLDHSVERAVGEGVHFDFGFLPDFDQAELRFGNIDADVDLIFFEPPGWVLMRGTQVRGATGRPSNIRFGGLFDFAWGAWDFVLCGLVFPLGRWGGGAGVLSGAGARHDEPFGLLRL